MNDSYNLDNMRTIIRDEFERIVEDRVSILIAKVVTEQTALATLPLQKTIAELKKRVAELESQLKPLQDIQMTSKKSGDATLAQILPLALQAQTSLGITDAMKIAGSEPSSSKPIIQSHPIISEPTTNQCASEFMGFQWTAINKKRRPSAPAGVMRGAAAPGTTKLEAADRRRMLHLYYVKVGTTEDQVRDHLNSIVDENTCKVESLKARGNYASFKFDVPSKLADAIMSPANWAEDICVKSWRQSFRAKNKEIQGQN